MLVDPDSTNVVKTVIVVGTRTVEVTISVMIPAAVATSVTVDAGTVEMIVVGVPAIVVAIVVIEAGKVRVTVTISLVAKPGAVVT